MAACGRGNVALARVACARLRPCGPPLRCSAPLAPRPSPVTGSPGLRPCSPVIGRPHPPGPATANHGSASSLRSLASLAPALTPPLSFLAAKAARIAAVEGPAAKERRLWPALVAAAALLLTAPQAFASRTVGSRPELLASPVLQPAATAHDLAHAYLLPGFELHAAADPRPRVLGLFPDLEPPPASFAAEKLASGVARWEPRPNLQRIQEFVAETWWVREHLGPVDSPNLYAAFGLDPHNNTDPYGLCVWGDWECWGWVARDFMVSNAVTTVAVAHGAYEATGGFVQGVSGSVLPNFPGTSPSPADSGPRRAGQVLGAGAVEAAGAAVMGHGGGMALGGGLTLVTTAGAALPVAGPAIAVGAGETLLGGHLYKGASDYLKQARSTQSTSETEQGSGSSSRPRRPTDDHHSDSQFLGGDPDQPRTSLNRPVHQELHRDLNQFLRQQEDEFSNHMRPQRGNPGIRIRQNFSREQRLAAEAEFYKGPGSKYTDAAADFFRQHPGLK